MRFPPFLKSSLHSRLAGLDWFLHLPLDLLGLRSVPKEDTSFSVSKAVFGAPLSVPGEFINSPELPSFSYLQKIYRPVAGVAVPPPHHVHKSPPSQRLPALLTAQFLFAWEDAAVSLLALLYHEPYLILEQQ